MSALAILQLCFECMPEKMLEENMNVSNCQCCHTYHIVQLIAISQNGGLCP